MSWFFLKDQKNIQPEIILFCWNLRIVLILPDVNPILRQIPDMSFILTIPILKSERLKIWSENQVIPGIFFPSTGQNKLAGGLDTSAFWCYPFPSGLSAILGFDCSECIDLFAGDLSHQTRKYGSSGKLLCDVPAYRILGTGQGWGNASRIITGRRAVYQVTARY